MKRTLFFATLLLSAVALFTSSCGTSDSIKSLMLTSSGGNSNFYNLAGVDSTLQLKVSAVYNSGKMIDVTNAATWSVSPVCCDQTGANLPPYGPTSVPINKTGMMTDIALLCTWTDATDPTTGKPASPAIWQYTGYYQTTASYRGFTSQPIAIGVGSVASITAPGGGCGPA